jgi:hypothetical protein
LARKNSQRKHGLISYEGKDHAIPRHRKTRKQQDVPRFRQPIPLNEELRVVGRLTKDTRRIFAGTGEILLRDGSVAVEAEGKYFKLPLEKIADFDAEEQEFPVVPADNDPQIVEL